MQLRLYCKWMVITGTAVIWIIKLFLRPDFLWSTVPRFLLGIAPNFLSAFLIPFAVYWIMTHPKFLNRQLLRFDLISDMRLVCLFGFLIATINEYIQLIPSFGRTFDYFDIVSSAVGLLFSYYSFNALQRRLAL